MGDLDGRGTRESWCLCAGGGDPVDYGSAPSSAAAADRKTVPPLCETFNSGLCVCIFGVVQLFYKGLAELSTQGVVNSPGLLSVAFLWDSQSKPSWRFLVGKRPPNAKHSPSLKRVFSGLLQCVRGFLSYCLLVVHRAFPGPQVCVFCPKASLASKSFPTFLVHLKDQFPGKERGILGHCLGAS